MKYTDWFLKNQKRLYLKLLPNHNSKHMEVNTLPQYTMIDNPTGCCPRFIPEGWDSQELHFKDKLFVKAQTKCLFHVPVNMGRVFTKTFDAIEKAEAMDKEQFIVLSKDISPWKSEHLFSVNKKVPGQNMVLLSGDYLTQVFEGPYKKAPEWYNQMKGLVQQDGRKAQNIYFFYTTCPKCARYYGKNYVVGVADTD